MRGGITKKKGRGLGVREYSAGQWKKPRIGRNLDRKKSKLLNALRSNREGSRGEVEAGIASTSSSLIWGKGKLAVAAGMSFCEKSHQGKNLSNVLIRICIEIAGGRKNVRRISLSKSET